MSNLGDGSVTPPAVNGLPPRNPQDVDNVAKTIDLDLATTEASVIRNMQELIGIFESKGDHQINQGNQVARDVARRARSVLVTLTLKTK
ncbi:hypothetical protein OROHE_005961 [Orobanche hederae]